MYLLSPTNPLKPNTSKAFKTLRESAGVDTCFGIALQTGIISIKAFS